MKSRSALLSSLSLSLALVACGDIGTALGVDSIDDESRTISAIASDGTSLYAAIAATRHGRSGAIDQRGAIVRVDLASGRREEIYPGVDPCMVLASNGLLVWLDVGFERYSADVSVAPADGTGPMTTPNGSHNLWCGSSVVAWDGDGSFWWLAGETPELRRWSQPDKRLSTLPLADVSSPKDGRYGIAANATHVAVGYGDDVLVVRKDGAGHFVMPRIDHNAIDDIGRMVEWVGLSATKVYWMTHDDHRTRVYSADIAADAEPLEHTALQVTKGAPVLVGDDLYACGMLPGQPYETGTPLHTTHGGRPRALADTQCTHLTADASRVVWRDPSGAFVTAPR